MGVNFYKVKNCPIRQEATILACPDCKSLEACWGNESILPGPSNPKGLTLLKEILKCQSTVRG